MSRRTVKRKYIIGLWGKEWYVHAFANSPSDMKGQIIEEAEKSLKVAFVQDDEMPQGTRKEIRFFERVFIPNNPEKWPDNEADFRGKALAELSRAMIVARSHKKIA